MKINARELQGPALDWAVAKAEGWDDETLACLCRQYETRFPTGQTPTTSRDQALLLIEQHLIELHTYTGEQHGEHERWYALCPVDHIGRRGAFGPTPMIAAMRALVFANMGEWVEIPDELAG